MKYLNVWLVSRYLAVAATGAVLFVSLSGVTARANSFSDSLSICLSNPNVCTSISLSEADEAAGINQITAVRSRTVDIGPGSDKLTIGPITDTLTSDSGPDLGVHPTETQVFTTNIDVNSDSNLGFLASDTLTVNGVTASLDEAGESFGFSSVTIAVNPVTFNFFDGRLVSDTVSLSGFNVTLTSDNSNPFSDPGELYSTTVTETIVSDGNVPEPGTLLLLSSGLLGLVPVVRRRMKI